MVPLGRFPGAGVLADGGDAVACDEDEAVADDLEGLGVLVESYDGTAGEEGGRGLGEAITQAEGSEHPGSLGAAHGDEMPMEMGTIIQMEGMPLVALGFFMCLQCLSHCLSGCQHRSRGMDPNFAVGSPAGCID